ncbi:FMR1-interacting protein NUFIP2-like isoform X2 [Ictalurus furcatus]|uniref:FMR1-interacting protein NUFIP2-like isoform X2 n=1 Tax=Ictalurus furcatus TaxID=66913 RepID=UPI0023502FAF|nr:FMR1-interacting protein NUFIP2-like isoform X2 [Ictalurus furcatus]
MDGDHQASVLKLYEVQNMREKEPALSLNGEVVLASGYITNGYSGKSADNDGSGSESGYTTPKKRRARRSSVKGTENNAGREKEKAPKIYSKQDTESSGQEMSGKALQSRTNCARTCHKPEVHAGVCKTGVQDASPVFEVQHRNSDSKNSLSLVGKKTSLVSKTKPVSSVSSKEDSWTLFKPPPVFPVDNSSAKIVPKISYASKVKENLNKATQASTETMQTSGKLSHVPMSAVKTVTSAGFANVPVSLDANGCFSVERSFASSASSNLAEEDVESVPDNLSSCSSAPEPPKSRFVYPHKPLNMQPPAAQTNQKALGDIFQNQWGLSFINEPNAGPDWDDASRPAAPFELSDVTFQGGNVPFLIQPSPNAVSLPEPQDVQRRTYGTAVAVKPCSAPRIASRDECKVECRSSDASYEDLDGESTRSYEGLSEVHTVKEQGGALGWGWADVQAAAIYHTKEFEYLLTLHKQDPKRVTYYEEVMDGPDH